MPQPLFDRFQVAMRPLAERRNKVHIERDAVTPDSTVPALSDAAASIVAETAGRIRDARRRGEPVVMAFGAHTIKNGLGPVLIRLLEAGWITHLATNGAGIIHDWEFAWQGASSEDVRENVAIGAFGNWEETGYCINLALNVGAFEERGYGESVGAMIETESLTIPSESELENIVQICLPEDPSRAAAAAELIGVVRRFNLQPGRMAIPHKWKRFSPQAAAFRLGIPFTGHPMIGHDIIYNHPMNTGALLGLAAKRDWLCFAESIRRLEGGVYLSVGSAVMSPMIFEKAFSMAQNLAHQAGRNLDKHFILVADLAESHWDWRQGEPPQTSPDYYLRFNKTFNRMGGAMRYLSIDNRDLLLNLCKALE